VTEQQRQILNIAARLGADPREVELAVALARTGRVDLIVAVTARNLTIRAALKVARTNSPRTSSQGR
jgi:hypothetical protein